MDQTEKRLAKGFLDALRDRPGFILGRDGDHLVRVEAYLCAIMDTHIVEYPQGVALKEFLRHLPRYLLKELTGDESKSGDWFEILLERNEGDHKRAFEDFVRTTRFIAEREGLI
jgi:hypothetical protein